MTARERARSGILADFSVLFQTAITYRMPMVVKDMVSFHHFPKDNVYYRCPRCRELLPREFVAYCDRCGQCLDWRGYRKVRRTYFKPKR